MIYHRHCLQGHRGQCKGTTYVEVKLKYHIFPHLVAIFRQYFIGTYVRGCTCCSQSGRVTECILGQLGPLASYHANGMV